MLTRHFFVWKFTLLTVLLLLLLLVLLDLFLWHRGWFSCCLLLSMSRGGSGLLLHGGSLDLHHLFGDLDQRFLNLLDHDALLVLVLLVVALGGGLRGALRSGLLAEGLLDQVEVILARADVGRWG